jgi:hypothetical protein
MMSPRDDNNAPQSRRISIPQSSGDDLWAGRPVGQKGGRKRESKRAGVAARAPVRRPSQGPHASSARETLLRDHRRERFISRSD